MTGDDGSSPSDRWRAVRPDDDHRLGTLWIRWTDGGTDLHLHRVCEVVPQVRFSKTPPFIHSKPEKGKPPTFTPVRDDEDDPDDIQFRFLSGWPRWLLRHVPLVILIATLIIGIGAEFTPGVHGVSELLPEFAGPDALLLGLFLLITPVLIWLFATVDVVDYREFPTAVTVYGLVILLAGGVGASLLFWSTASHPSETPPSVVFVSGYLLMLLVAGLLLYEATLRIEHLFTKLHRRQGDVVGDERAYRRFLTDLHETLNEASIFGVHPSRLFGLLIAAQFAIIWSIGFGPQHLGFGLGTLVNFILNAVLGTVAFQFLILVRYFNRLFNITDDYQDVELTYQPFHVDGRGGFRDFGRFATRINVILSMGGLYVVFRLYVVGGRALPVEGLAGFTDPLPFAVWLVSYIGPIVAYTLGAGAWAYYSFWMMHRKMLRDKHELARQYQGISRRKNVERGPAAGDDIDAFEDEDGPAWGSLVDAPTWPLDVGKMVSLLSGNAIPLLVPASNLLF
ncbi:MAG: hypothetical protein ABEH64_07215 [Salinirussus sp.]